MSALTLLMAVCLAAGVFVLRKRMNSGLAQDRQTAQLQQFEQRLTQVAQQSTDQVTAAVLQLEERLEQAHATIEELRYRTQLAEGLLWQTTQAPADPSAAPQTEPAAGPRPDFSKQLAVAAYQLNQQFDRGEPEEAAAAALASPQALASVAETLADDKAVRYESVIALAARGLSDMEIAKALNLGMGEVRLAKQLLQSKARRHE